MKYELPPNLRQQEADLIRLQQIEKRAADEVNREKLDFLRDLKRVAPDAVIHPVQIRYGFWRRLKEKLRSWRLKREVERLRAQEGGI